MTIKKYAGDKATGLASDTKPTNMPDGATFYELDTGKVFRRFSSTWLETDSTKANNAYNTANTANLTANLAFINANAAYSQANAANLLAFNTGLGANAFASATIAGANTISVAAFQKANAALPTAGGTITGDLIVSGNITISGNTSYVNTQTLLIGDNIIVLNADLTAALAPSENAGVTVNRGSSANAELIWNETSDKWTFSGGDAYLNIASNTDVEIVGANATSAFINSNLAFNKANTANLTADLAFNKANAANVLAFAALPNTSGVSFAGNLFFPTGNVGIGTSSTTSKLHLETLGGSTLAVKYVAEQNIAIDGYVYANNAALWQRGFRARVNAAFPSIVSSGDLTSLYSGYGYDGSAYIENARIAFNVDGTPGTNDMPGRLVFSTTADGASSVTERLRIDSAGQVTVGTSGATTGTTFQTTKNLTGATTAVGIASYGIVQSDVTVATQLFRTALSTVDATFTIPSAIHYNATQGTIGASSNITAQYGFSSAASLIGATTNYGFAAQDTSSVGTGKTAYGFYSAINLPAAGGTTYGFYSAGTANNYFNGNIGIGVLSPTSKLHVSGSANITTSLIVDTMNVVPTINAAFYRANNTGGYYSGNNGDVGTPAGLGDIFRVHTNTLTANVTIYSGNNSLAAGPITIATGKTLTIQANARVSIV